MDTALNPASLESELITMVNDDQVNMREEEEEETKRVLAAEMYEGNGRMCKAMVGRPSETH